MRDFSALNRIFLKNLLTLLFSYNIMQYVLKLTEWGQIYF